MIKTRGEQEKYEIKFSSLHQFIDSVFIEGKETKV